MSTDPLPVIQMTVPTNVCLNTNLKLQTQGINQSFIWLGPQNFQSTLATTYVMMNDSLAAGIYTLIVRNENNCVNTATAQVKVWKLPMASLLATKQEVCVPACQQFTLVPGLKQGPLKDIRYSLNSEPVAGSNLCFKKEGIYLVNAQYADTIGCINTSTLVIIAHEKPRAEFMTSPQEPIASVDETRFYDYSTGKNLSSYAWYIGDKITDTLLQKNITHRFNEAGVFPVVLVVSNGWNCADTVIHPITVYEAYNFYIPNSFSPNGDGLNDVFLPKAEGIVNYSMEIFDRWGQIIFRTNDVSVGWDGTYQQKPCSNDTYVWKINFKIRGGISKNLTGSVSVIR
jgi:gliding motility-associated-like protein